MNPLGAQMDKEDLMKKILDGIADEYKEIVYVVQACDTPITFDELHEKLINFEAFLHTKQPALDDLPATANQTYQNTNWYPSHSPSYNRGWHPFSLSSNRSPMASNIELKLVPS